MQVDSLRIAGWQIHGECGRPKSDPELREEGFCMELGSPLYKYFQGSLQGLGNQYQALTLDWHFCLELVPLKSGILGPPAMGEGGQGMGSLITAEWGFLKSESESVMTF